MNSVTKFISKAAKYVIYGYKCSEQTYLKHLRNIGIRIGEGTRLFNSKTILIDETDPQMLNIGRNVQITGGYNINSRLRLGRYQGRLRRCFGLCQTCYDRR